MKNLPLFSILFSLLKLLLLHILPSLLDMSSDLLNSLDMLGYNATSQLTQGTVFQNLLIPSNHSLDPSWGILSLLLIFLPGLPCFFFLLILKVKNNQFCFKPFYLLILCYPLATILLFIGNILGIIVDYHPDKNFLIRELCAAEAFFESCPQMILQLFTIQLGYPLGPVQGITITISFLFLTKASIVFEWKPEEEVKSSEERGKTTEEGGKTYEEVKSSEEGERPKWRRFLHSLPLYVTGIMFRVGSTSLLLGHLGKWTIIPILLCCVAYGLIAWRCGYRDNLPIAVLGNIGTITSGVVNKAVTGHPKKVEFVKMSILYTFLHLTVLLLGILVVANVRPDLFYHLVYLKYVNYVFPTIIFVGVLNLYFISERASKMFEEIIEIPSKKDEEIDLENV